MNIVTQDLSQFGNQGRQEAIDLLTAWKNEGGLPEDFSEGNVTLWFNTQSGSVFLSNCEYEVAALTPEGKLACWYDCPNCGNEGFNERDYPFKQYDGCCSAQCQEKG